MTEKFREVLLIVACAVLATCAAIGWMRQPEAARASETLAVTAPVAEAKAVTPMPVQSYAAPVRSSVAPAPAAQPKKRSLAKSAIIVGAAAGTGAAIGGIAGGGKGAAIGAISGGAAGVIYDRATANKPR